MSELHKSLPGWSYTSDAFFELEKQKLFLENWQLVCHVSNIPNYGDYFTFELFDQRIFAIRGKDNNVRIFHNVCSHRATKLLDEVSGNCNEKIICPYHAWGYDLEGNLAKVPYEDQFIDLDKNTLNLKSVEMEIFQGFIFARITPSNGPSVADQFQPYL